MGGALSHLDGSGSQLVKAVKCGDASLVAELISASPRLLRYATMQQFTLLHFAARENHTDVLQQLLSRAEEVELMQLEQGGRMGRPCGPRLAQQLVNAFSDRGITPLMLAAQHGCLASVKLLLAKGADPWAVDNLGGHTALHYAAKHDNVEVTAALLTAVGEDRGPIKFPNRPNTRYVDLRTQPGLTAVHFAAHAGTQQSLAALLNAGANPMLSSLYDCMECLNCPRGSTPLHLAARTGNSAAAKQLLKAYVEHWHHRNTPDPRLILDGDDHLPWQVAAQRQHAELAHSLLPSTPLAALCADAKVVVLGPPSLAQLAGSVLRQAMEADLRRIWRAEGLAPADEAAATTAAVATSSPTGGASTAPSGVEQADSGLAAVAQDVGKAAGSAIDAPAHRVSACKLPVWPQHIAPPAKQDVSSTAAVLSLERSTSSTTGSSCSGCSAAASSSLSSSSSGELCSVCFEAAPLVALQPCQHQLCVHCCSHLLQMNSRCVLVCPFCRAGVCHLARAAAVVV